MGKGNRDGGGCSDTHIYSSWLLVLVCYGAVRNSKLIHFDFLKVQWCTVSLLGKSGGYKESAATESRLDLTWVWFEIFCSWLYSNPMHQACVPGKQQDPPTLPQDLALHHHRWNQKKRRLYCTGRTSTAACPRVGHRDGGKPSSPPSSLSKAQIRGSRSLACKFSPPSPSFYQR